MSPHDELRDLLILKSSIPWDDYYVAYQEAWKLFGASKITHKEFRVAMKGMTVAFDIMDDFLLD
jgi:hypothetical protein